MANRKHAPSAPHQGGIHSSPMAQRDSAANQGALISRSIDDLCINTIRTLSIDAVEKAESGHPGLPMGAASMAYVLWTRHLRHDPSDPEWMNRDRFVLSAGHG